MGFCHLRKSFPINKENSAIKTGLATAKTAKKVGHKKTEATEN